MHNIATSLKRAFKVSIIGAILSAFALLPMTTAIYIVFSIFDITISFIKIELFVSSIAFVAFFAQEVYYDDAIGILTFTRKETA